MTKPVRHSISLLVILYLSVLIIYSPTVFAGDEPAPVIYMDPETGELRVQNPPKLSREHETEYLSTDNTSQITAPELKIRKDSMVLKGIVIFGFVIIMIWAFMKSKKTAS
ncbi:MAG: hypothetical protein ACI9XC_000315 [Gammaproteobacteria bacterium]|jgi:hypothetical protein